MSRDRFSFSKYNRRDLLRAGFSGLSLAAGTALRTGIFGQAASAIAAEAESNGKILVVLELSGGNDGLNTVVPYGDDAYYKHRPKLGIRPAKVRKIDDHFGFNPGMAGF